VTSEFIAATSLLGENVNRHIHRVTNSLVLSAVTVYCIMLTVKLRLPDDGNLYNMSAARFADLLDCLQLDAQVSAACRRRRMDGRQFSQLTENEMELSGLLHPVLLHFRRLTVVKKQLPLRWSAVRRS